MSFLVLTYSYSCLCVAQDRFRPNKAERGTNCY